MFEKWRETGCFNKHIYKLIRSKDNDPQRHILKEQRKSAFCVLCIAIVYTLDVLER